MSLRGAEGDVAILIVFYPKLDCFALLAMTVNQEILRFTQDDTSQ